MTQANKLIKISGVTYIAFALFLIRFLPIFAGILLVIGLVLLANSFASLAELNKKKAMILIIAILSFFINIPAGILLVIAFSSITSAKQNCTNAPPEENISAESKKIDILLKIGLAMVLIAGILFATTTWDFITDTFKLISLIFMGLIFLALSVFSEYKLKIKQTTKAYFMLGLAFFILTFIGVGYFAPFSSWFSYTGVGKHLVYTITYFLTAIAFYLVNYKFKDQECLYLAHASLYLTVYSLLRFTTLPVVAVLLIMTTLTFLLNIFSKNKQTSLQRFNATTTYLYFPLLIIESFTASFSLLLGAIIINIIDMLLQSTKTPVTATKSIATSILSYILVFFSLGQIPYDGNILLPLFIAVTILAAIIKLTPLSKYNYLSISSQITYHVISFYIIMYYLFNPSLESIIITGVYLLLNILGSLNIINKQSSLSAAVDFYYQPIVIFYFISSLLGYLYENIYQLDLIFIPVTCGLIYILIDCFAKSTKVKNYYIVYAVIGAVLSLLINIDVLNIIAGLIILLLGLYLYLRSKDKTAKTWSYLFIIISIYSLTTALLPITYANVLALLIFGLLVLVIKDRRLSVINYLSITIPLLSIINNVAYEYYVYKLIATNILDLYVVFLFIKYLVTPKNTKDLLATIFYAIVTSFILFRGILEVGIYIGLLSIIIIFVTISNADYKKLFYASIIILIINILVQLWDFWGILPFWLYLLLAGLSIIIFVTYKELNKDKKQVQLSSSKPTPLEEPKSIQQKPNSSQKDQIILAEPVEIKANSRHQESNPNSVKEEMLVGKFCPSCGTPNTHNGNFCKNCGHNLIIKK